MDGNESNVRAHPTSEAAALEERKVAAKRRKAEAEAKRSELREEREAINEVEQAEMDASDSEAIVAAEEKHGEVGKSVEVIYTKRGCVIVKSPSAMAYRRFIDRGADKTADMEKLVRACLVHPTVSGFEAICDEVPAALTQSANKAVKLAGHNEREVSGK